MENVDQPLPGGAAEEMLRNMTQCERGHSLKKAALSGYEVARQCHFVETGKTGRKKT